jgi:hypothetical protein
MATGLPSRTLDDTLRQLEIPDTEDNRKLFDISGRTPQGLTAHSTAKTYNIIGYSPADFMIQHGSVGFDIHTLYGKFAKICPDFEQPLALDSVSYAVEFCARIIYEVGPESRKVKKGSGDKMWVFRFPKPIGEGEGKQLAMTYLYVCTFKEDDAVFIQTADDQRMNMSLKQAGLCAMHTFTQICRLAASKPTPVYLMTPLAGAVFSKDDVEALAKALGATIADVIVAINTSCQSGGQHLLESKGHIAAVAAIIATRNVKDIGARNSIINKTVKQFITAKKEFSPALFNTYAQFANGGVPSEYSAEILITRLNDAQISFRTAKRSSDETKKEVKIDVPNFGPDQQQ